MPRTLLRVLSVVALCLVFGVGLAWASHDTESRSGARATGEDLSAGWNPIPYKADADKDDNDIVRRFNRLAGSSMYGSAKPLSEKLLTSRSEALCTIVGDYYKTEAGATARSLDWSEAKKLLDKPEAERSTSDPKPRIFERLRAISKTSKTPVSGGAKPKLEPFDITHVSFVEWEPNPGASVVAKGELCSIKLLNSVTSSTGEPPICARKDLKTSPLPSPTPGEPKCPEGSASLSEILAVAEKETKDEQVRTCIEAQDGKCRMMVVRTIKAEPEPPKDGEAEAPKLSNGWQPVKGKDGVYLRGIAKDAQGNLAYLACVPSQYAGSLGTPATPDRTEWADKKPVKCSDPAHLAKYLRIATGDKGGLYTEWPPGSRKLVPLNQHQSVARDIAGHFASLPKRTEPQEKWWTAYKAKQSATQPTTAVAANANVTATAAANSAAVTPDPTKPATLPKCLGCHGKTGKGPEIVSIEAYKARVSSTDDGDRMPPPPKAPLTEEERAKLLGLLK